MNIDRRCIKLSESIYLAYSSLNLYWGITKNAKQINRKFPSFFGMVQRIALSSAILEICKIYELNDRYKLYSIPSLCGYFENKELFSSPEKFVVDARKIGIRFGKKRNDLPSFFSERIKDQIKIKPVESPNHLQSFEWMREALEKALSMRDKQIAHAEIHSDRVFGPSIHRMEKLLRWAEKFVDVVSDNFTQNEVCRDTKGDADRIKPATSRVLRELKVF